LVQENLQQVQLQNEKLAAAVKTLQKQHNNEVGKKNDEISMVNKAWVTERENW